MGIEEKQICLSMCLQQGLSNHSNRCHNLMRMLDAYFSNDNYACDKLSFAVIELVFIPSLSI